MNFINTIEIKNFKSIRHQKIEGCKRVNVFIGYPNVGKSNILEALSLFSVSDANVDLSSIIRFEKLPTFFYNGRIGEQCEIISNYQYRCSIVHNNSRLIFNYEFDSAKIGFETLDQSQGSSREKNKFFELAEDNSKHNFWKNDKKEEPINEVKKYEYRKRIKFEGGYYQSLKNPFGENIFSIISTNENLYKEVQELFNPYNLELLFDSREQKFTILKRTKTGIFSIPYELVADTLQRVIFYKSAILSNKKSVLLFEEPEAHMFPPYIKKITTDIIFDKLNQFFITTHSPYVLDELIAEASDDLSVYLVDYKEGETKIYYLKEEDLTEIREYGVDLFFNIESYLQHGQINNA